MLDKRARQLSLCLVSRLVPDLTAIYASLTLASPAPPPLFSLVFACTAQFYIRVNRDDEIDPENRN